MARVPTVDEVRQVISTGLSDTDVAAIIGDAQLIVEACVADLDDERTTAIVKYVTADLIASTVATRGRGVQTSKALGDASESWDAGNGASEFGRSVYWAQALALDPNGCIEKLGKRRALLEKV